MDMEGNTISEVEDLSEYIQLVYNWSIGAIAIIAVVMIMIAGFQWISSAGNTKAIGSAQQRIKNAIFGLVLVGGAYLILQLINPAILGKYGHTIIPKVAKVLGLSRSTSNCPMMLGDAKTVNQIMSDSNLIIPADNQTQYDEILREKAEKYNLDCDYLKAIMFAETRGNSDARSRDATTGDVIACGLMQVKPSTASGVGLNFSCNDLLIPANAIEAGAKYLSYLEGLSTTSGDFNLMAAAYNGGDDSVAGANGPSTDCPGLLRWQCEWDDKGHTIANEGYAETRDYVQKTQGYLNYIVGQGLSCNADGPRAGVCLVGGVNRASASEELGYGWAFDRGIEAQLPDAAPEIIQLLNCMRPKLPDGVGRISSISDNHGIENCLGSDYPGKCSRFEGDGDDCCYHSQYSCHYGGRNCEGISYALDFGDGDPGTTAFNQLSDAAKACGVDYALSEGDHLHVSLGKTGGCGCQ
jgi:hypothetical protein